MDKSQRVGDQKRWRFFESQSSVHIWFSCCGVWGQSLDNVEECPDNVVISLSLHSRFQSPQGSAPPQLSQYVFTQMLIGGLIKSAKVTWFTLTKFISFYFILSQQLMSTLGKKFVLAWQLQHLSDNFDINWPDQSTLCHAKIPILAIYWKLKYKFHCRSKHSKLKSGLSPTSGFMTRDMSPLSLSPSLNTC